MVHAHATDWNTAAELENDAINRAQEIEYEQRRAMAPVDEYQAEAEGMILDALAGGKDELELGPNLIEAFEGLSSLNKLVEIDEAKAFVFSTPKHLERIVRWTIRDTIREWVNHKVDEYAKEPL